MSVGYCERKENGAENPITPHYTRDRTVLVREKKQNKAHFLSLFFLSHAPTHALYSEAVKIPFLSLRFATTQQHNLSDLPHSSTSL
ncbi:hypothetical protein VNO80_14990 [Phaseolus coccineus]|uniref:Uncharacterized protein n=1 Tax=Phaseolus coccineus TaxID=3886 RepID=A0AAN9QYW6_PHACN